MVEVDETTKAFLSTEQYMFRRIADLCLDYMKINRRLYSGKDVRAKAMELGSILNNIVTYAEGCETFSSELRSPPLDNWVMIDMKDPHHWELHPVMVNEYVMDVYREIQKQQSKKIRPINTIHKKFGGKK